MNELALREFSSPKPHFVPGKDFEVRPKPPPWNYLFPHPFLLGRSSVEVVSLILWNKIPRVLDVFFSHLFSTKKKKKIDETAPQNV